MNARLEIYFGCVHFANHKLWGIAPLAETIVHDLRHLSHSKISTQALVQFESWKCIGFHHLVAFFV